MCVRHSTALSIALSVLLIGLLLTGCDDSGGNKAATAGETPTAQAVDMNGIWDAWWWDEDRTTEYFTFEQAGTSLSGTWRDDEDGFMGLSGTISGRSLDIMVYYPSPIFWHVEATLNESGTEFNGNVTVRNAGRPYNGVHAFRCVRRIP